MSDGVSPVQVPSDKATKRDTFLISLLALSLSLNVFLGWRVRQLSYTIAFRPDSIALSVGATIPPLTANALDDRQETITHIGIGRPTVLYFFSPACIWCERNIGNIRTLAKLREDSYRFIGVSLADTGLKEYLDTHKFNFPVYKNLSPNSIRELGLGGTPQTIVISPDGKVLKNWIGAYGQRLQGEVEAYFDIRLPGVIPPDKPSQSASSSQNCTD